MGYEMWQRIEQESTALLEPYNTGEQGTQASTSPEAEGKERERMLNIIAVTLQANHAESPTSLLLIPARSFASFSYERSPRGQGW